MTPDLDKSLADFQGAAAAVETAAARAMEGTNMPSVPPILLLKMQGAMANFLRAGGLAALSGLVELRRAAEAQLERAKIEDRQARRLQNLFIGAGVILALVTAAATGVQAWAAFHTVRMMQAEQRERAAAVARPK